MPSKLYDWLGRIKEVEREHATISFATINLLEAARRDSAILRRELRVRDVQRAAARLDGTYVIRIFSTFESGLREFWRAARNPDPPSRMRDLIDGVGAMRRIPHRELQHAHQVRDFRNLIVHENAKQAVAIDVPTVRGALCRFFAFLPPDW